MTAMYELLGALIIAYIVRDVFHTIFHPVGTGMIGEHVGRAVWRLYRKVGGSNHKILSIAGPLAMSSVIVIWFVALTLAFTLIFLPFMPDRFVFISGIDPNTQRGFISSLYASLVTVTTLGYGDVAPKTHWLRLMAPFAAVLGMALFTASVSWVLATYPPLNRRQSLANQLSILRDAEQEKRMDPLDADESFVGGLLLSLAEQIITLRTDFVQFPITYYFHSIHARDEVANVLAFAYGLARRGMQTRWPPGTRIAASLLLDSLSDLAKTVGPKYLALDVNAGTREILDAFQEDHMCTPRSRDDKADRKKRAA